MISLKAELQTGIRTLIAGTPEGADMMLVAKAAGEGSTVLFVARDDMAMFRRAEALSLFAPDIECLEFPAWDCLPYDRVSPRGEIVSTRINTLSQLVTGDYSAKGRVILTTVSALLQRVIPRDSFRDACLVAQKGTRLDPEALYTFLQNNGYQRTDTVMEPGEYAVRGGIVDVFPSGSEYPLRLDFFGDELEQIRPFDPVSQRSLSGEEPPGDIKAEFRPVSEVLLSEESISRFRSGYRVMFEVSGSEDPLYESVTAGQRHIGMEHWLPLFHEHMETLFDYIPGALVVLDHQIEESRDSRLDQVAEYYNARQEFAATPHTAGELTSGSMYHPVPPEQMFLNGEEWDRCLQNVACGVLSPFAVPDDTKGVIDLGIRVGRDFAEIRVQPDLNVYDTLREHIHNLHKKGQRVVLAAFSEGSRDRLGGVLKEHSIEGIANVESWSHAESLPKAAIGFTVTGLEKGFVTDSVAIISEQDILGERLGRAKRQRIRAENFIAETSSLNAGDLVVHVDHGISRFDGLVTIEVGGAPHDCLRLVYHGEDKLFLPVENIEMISRFGSEDASAQLDRLGGAAWQARKAKLKDRVKDIADELIRVAAARTLREGNRIEVEPGIYDEFCARFPYTETEDQARAISDTMADLASGRPVDRLVCGDVGFGKTEVALRTAFAVAMTGKQVVIVVPTTLLCRQHYINFTERFSGFPVRVEQLSRLVNAKLAKETKKGMVDGTVDIVIGTHALLAKDIRFRDLGLLIIDEEQHFGVTHKERLKKLKSDVHVVTLTATPIPRTLQLAMSGIKEMSLIATPPVDRLAVRTFIMPYDPVVIREAIMRERFRGGQTFYVCPRVADLAEVEEALRELVPEVRISVAHGRMSPTDLEDTISKFYDGAFDVLLSTNIVESGLDLPTCNTIILHRADMYGLAQLYQLRGRVGRSKTRAYAYLTLPPKRRLTKTAQKRLEVMQTLDTLGAGFSLASHDLDIRGAGNLLGDEQSGHIREVGIELYQQMLEEAVAEAKGLTDGVASEQEWSPQIGIGMPVLIPEFYVSDLTVRMGLYRRLAWLDGRDEIESFAAELIDRFGPLPEEAGNLLQTIEVKNMCKTGGIEKVDAGPKGAVVTFRNSEFSNPAGLVAYLQAQKGMAKLRPDHKLVFPRRWDTPKERLSGVKQIARELAEVAAEGIT